jgi:hypothetical protein
MSGLPDIGSLARASQLKLTCVAAVSKHELSSFETRVLRTAPQDEAGNQRAPSFGRANAASISRRIFTAVSLGS